MLEFDLLFFVLNTNVMLLKMRIVFSGLTFFGIVSEQLYSSNNDETQVNQGKNAKVWSIVLQTLKVDILICLDKYPDEKSMVIKKILEEEKQFDCPTYGSFPSSAVLLFRGYFLDNVCLFNLKYQLKTY